MNNLHVGITLALRDMFTGPARGAGQQLEALHAKSRRVAEQNMRSLRDFSFTMASAGGVALYGMNSWIQRGSEFGYTMEFVRNVTEATTSQFASLNKEASRLAQSSIFRPQEVASGMQYMAMAGMNAEQIEKNIGAATKLAQATKTNLGGKGGAADIMTNIMKGFQINEMYSSDAADVLASAATGANTSLFDLGEAMKYTMSTAKTLGYDVKESAAMIMLLGNAGIQGSMAGTAMENMLRYYSRIATDFRSGKQSEALAMIGLSPSDIADAHGNMLSMGEFLTRLRDKTSNLGTADKLGIFQVLFGVRGARASALATGGGLDDYFSFLDRLENSKGMSGRLAADMLDTPMGRYEEMISAFQGFQASFVTSIEPVLKGIYRLGTGFAQVITYITNIPFIGSFITGGAAGFILMYTAVFAVTTILSGLLLMISRIRNGFSLFTRDGVVGWNSITASINRATAAQGRFNAAQRSGVASAGLTMAAIRRDAGGRGSAWNQFMRGNVMMVNGRARFRRGTRIGGVNVGGRFASGFSRVGPVLGRFLPIIGRSLGLLTRAFSFLMGPWGMLAMFVLPGLIAAVSKLWGSTERANELKENEARGNAITEGRIVQGQIMKYELYDEQRQYAGSNIGNTIRGIDAGTWSDTAMSRPNTTIVINVDGEEKMKKVLNDVQSAQLYEENINI